MTNTKICVIEDEEDIARLIQYNLSLEGFEVNCSLTGEAGLESVKNDPPELIILDLMLPGLDGLTVCERLKAREATRNIPIIMVTAKGEEADMVRGLELGADDYVTKPFSPKVLTARVKAVLRRSSEFVPLKENEVIKIHELMVHPGRHEVCVKEEKIDLTNSEFKILQFLAGRPGWVFTRSQIVDAIRGENYAVTDRSIDFQIVGLRKKLGIASDYIETVRGVGYRFKE